MIHWTQQEEDICEGHFKSKFFRNDEQGDDFSVYAQNPSFIECAEKCVEAFNHLDESEINKICEGIVGYLKESGIDKEFELPALDNTLDILNYCWFVALYVNMARTGDEICYAVEGEGDWGEAIGFIVKSNKVIYVGADYLK